MTVINSVKQARKEDISSIASFLEHAALIHRHLDWRSTLDWLGSQPFLLWQEQGEIQGILVAVPDTPRIAWLHCFAVKSSSLVDEGWQKLYHEASAILKPSDISMYSIGLEDWFHSLLVRQGFNSSQDIVVLDWNHHISPYIEPAPGVTIRPMIASDLDEVAIVDEKSFEEQWGNNRETIELSYEQSQHSTVAEINDRIVGYELTTGTQYSAHLARLAVHPEFRQMGIARSLVTNMLRYFANMGVLQITVNTQSDNEASLHLYNRLGFSFSGESYPVFAL